MSVILELFLFFGGMFFCMAFIGRVCHEGDYDD